MRLHGEFLSRAGRRYRVEIRTRREVLADEEIGGNTVRFSASDAVEIRSMAESMTEPVLRHSCTIRLETRGYLPGLYCQNALEARVRVTEGTRTVFAGWVEPMSLSQEFSGVWDEIELNCIDSLSALQYTRYGDVGSVGVTHARALAQAGERSFMEILREALGSTTGGESFRIWYDGSKALTGYAGTVFAGLSLNELLPLGESEDETWTRLETVEEMLRYLDLHIEQAGEDFRIFDWRNRGSETAVLWTDLVTGITQRQEPRQTEVTKENCHGRGTSLSVGETWNRITVRCERQGLTTLVESPLEEEAQESPYTNRQKYLTEYSTDVKDSFDLKATQSFINMLAGEATEHGGSKRTDWYMQVWGHRSWQFGGEGWMSGLTEGKRYQECLPNAMAEGIHAALVAFGKVEQKEDKKDNSLVNRIDMTRYLAVSVNGNGDDTENGSYPQGSDLLAASPVATYTGRLTGGVYSPADPETTNYIVISGRMVLNPLAKETLPWIDRNTVDAKWWAPNGKTDHHLVASRTCEHGRYLSRRWWSCVTPGDEPKDTTRRTGLVPYTGDGSQEYEFKYSAIGDGTDTISKVGVLSCMLIIGDKVCVETGTQGMPGDFVWKPYKRVEDCADLDEYYAQSITIGFDPKIGDRLIGTEFTVQNNIDYTMGLDAEGMSIPVRAEDKLSGEVRFLILGPVNTLWGDVTRRHKTWFRRAKWRERT